MMLDCKFVISDGIGDTKLLALIDSGVLFNFMSSLVAKHLGWAIKPSNSPFSVKLANGTVVCSSLGVATRLVLSGVWQAYVIFLVLNIPFEVILGMKWFPCIFP